MDQPSLPRLPPSLEEHSRSRGEKAAVLFSLLIYAALMISVFSTADFWTRSFGPAVRGISTPLVVAILLTVFYLPAPWFNRHLMELVMRARELGIPIVGMLGFLRVLFTPDPRLAPLRRSRFIVMAGACYVVTLAGAWIVYADSRGL